MTDKIYTVCSNPRIPTFLVRAAHEEEARDLVRTVLRKEAFSAKLRDGNSDEVLITADKIYGGGKVLPLFLSEDSVRVFNMDESELDVIAVESTKTVEMMLGRLSMASPNLITAVSSCNRRTLASAYRRHQSTLKDWLDEDQ